MPYPAENIITNEPHPFGYALNGVPHITGNLPISRKYNIHPAAANATMLKGFKYCRGWDKTFGKYTLVDSGNSGWRGRIYTLGGLDLYSPLGAADAWFLPVVDVFPGVPSLPSGNIVNAALVTALNKLKDQDFHLGNFVAEAHKSLDMIGDRFTSIAKSVESFRAKRPKDWEKVKRIQTGNLPRKWWHRIPGYWLETQYGWKPLMQDVYGALHHILRASRYEVPYVFVESHKQTVSDFTHHLPLTGGPIWISGVQAGLGADLHFHDKQTVGVALVYGITSPLLAELSSLGLINPAEVLWETTRFSFVVDWALPIGPWLSALTAPVGYNFITGSLSLMTKREFVGSSMTGNMPSAVAGPSYVDYYGYPSAPVMTSTVGQFTRSCYTSSPVPGLYVKNPLSFDHVANGLSLLVQAFR